MKKSSIICFTTAVISVIIGISVLLTLPLILLKIINSKLVLSPGSDSYNLWKDLPVPILHKFYFYNVTNPREVQYSGAEPILTEVGPFVFRMSINKTDINFTDLGQSVTFRERMTYYFDRQLSSAELSLRITTLNAPLAIALSLMEPLNPVMKTLVTLVINKLNEEFFVDKSIGELLFDGYSDILTKMGPILNPKIPYQPSFGWMWKRNESNDGLFSVNTGKEHINQLNEIETYNGLPALTYWSSNRCNSLSGSKNGELFNPIKSADKSLAFFRTDFCRVWSLVWKEALKSSLGQLSVYRYFPADNTFANSTDYPPNSCFAPNTDKAYELFGTTDEFNIESIVERGKRLVGNDSQVFHILDTLKYVTNDTKNIEKEYRNAPNVWKFEEFPSGVFDLSACHYGAPIYISNPHFLNADPYYLSTVSGLTPNATTHQTFIDIEPITGTPIELKLRVQLNVYINRMADYFLKYRQMPRIHVPVLWQEFSIHVTDQIAHDLHWQLTGPSMIATIISSLFILTGALTLLIIVSKPVLKHCFHRRTYVTECDSSDTSALINDCNAVGANDIHS